MLSSFTEYKTIKYKFTKFERDAGVHLRISNKIRYFAECVYFSTELQPSQIETIVAAMKEWEKVTNIKFVYEDKNPDLFITSTDLNFFSDNESKKILGAGWEINFSKQQVIFIEQDSGHINQENSMWLILHELGHVPFSLKHISEYSNETHAPNDNSLSSVMSYNHVSNALGKKIYPATPSSYDIYLVQKTFGINKISTAGNDLYKFSYQNKNHYTLYDFDGEDTIDLSDFKENLNITLNNGEKNLNNISHFFSFSIYESTIIENIITGSGDDIIYGNNASNKIDAGAGHNIIYGGEGNDYFIFNKNNPSSNIIKDFSIGIDKILLKGYLLSCDNLQEIVTTNKSQTYIKPDSSTIIELQGNYENLTCNDFIFDNNNSI